ncbi:hypothetical protein PRIPAC_97690 [Pristionchus pacificus]|uniref:Uncharacterized protein n=1 Tax=Pristionchus pacificus TaxID=54126 RepID=A0A2A6BCR3_PRIPA|nr:hypothetical protein PRIPAC_97690 [Pristionchus pacificus]|eukprot:PDM63665.1 hypothetical protein PRIPAC_49638 [Pristionchus pacificus]
MSRSQSPVRCSDVVEATAAADAAQVAALEMATLRLEAWRSDESLAAEKIAKWPSNEFVLVPSITIDMRPASPCDDKMPTAFVRERLSPRTRSLESLTEVSCDVEKQSETDHAAIAARLTKSAAACTKRIDPLRNAHFANRPKRSTGIFNLTVLLEDEENDTESAPGANLLESPTLGMQRSISADLLVRKE